MKFIAISCLACIVFACFQISSLNAAEEKSFFIVVSVTSMGTGAVDVKLRNPRTGYIHSVTLYIDISEILFRPGDKVTKSQDKNGVRLEPIGGSKGVRRIPEDPPTKSKPETPDAKKLIAAINDCLQAKVPYYNAAFMNVQEGATTDGSPVMNSFDPPVLLFDPVQLKAIARCSCEAADTAKTMALARSVAEYVLYLRNKKFTPQERANCKADSNEQMEIYRLVGFLTRCVQDKGSVDVQDPRTIFKQTFAPPENCNDPVWREREDEMFYGYTSYPLLPPCIAKP